MELCKLQVKIKELEKKIEEFEKGGKMDNEDI